jgi:hypothetical protein
VQGLGAVADVVAEPAGVKDGSVFDALEIFLVDGDGGGDPTVLAQSGLETLPDFKSLPGLESYLFRALVVREDLSLEVETVVWQRTERVGVFEVDEVFGGLSLLEFRLTEGAPAVWLRAQVFDFVDGCRGAQKRGNVSGKGGGGQAINETMALIAPAETLGWEEESGDQQACGEAAKRQSAHRRKYSPVEVAGRNRAVS